MFHKLRLNFTFSKIISSLVSLVFLVLAMPFLVASLSEIKKSVGQKTVPVPVVGTGSMYPSLFWIETEGGPDDPEKTAIEEYRTTPHMYLRFKGITLFGKKYLDRELKAGDMVAFQNDATRKILLEEGKDQDFGFIKRIIALPGDTIELRDGYVYKNGEILAEPYIYRPRSTYGESFLPDCQKLVIPPNKYFVLGDNRKVSSDSRGPLGLIDGSDVTFVLPYEEQTPYQSLWRDPKDDDKDQGTPSLNVAEFYTLLNRARQEKNIPALKNVGALSNSSRLRANDSSSSLETALTRAGYSNILSGEFVSRGHFNAQELLENLLYFPSTYKQIMSPDYQEIGVTSLNKEVNGCPSEIVVGHLGGYIPASYDKHAIENWESLISNLDSVIPSWEKAKDYPGIDQDKLGRLLTILAERRSLAVEVVDTMKAKKWLSDELEARITADQTLADEASLLVEELNKE